ncbi:MAG: CgeB family protein [Burkholderiales bacterium]
MKILCVFGEHAYGDPARGAGYEFTHFLPAFAQLGHQPVRFDSFSRSGHASFAELNRAFLQAVERHAPDLVFCVLMHYEIWLESIALVRRAGIPVVNWSTDDSWKYRQFSRLVADAFDLFATTAPEALAWYARDGITAAFGTQWAAASGLLQPPKPAADCVHKASFVGARYGNRGAIVDALRAQGIEVACFGHGWPSGPVAAAEIGRIVRDSMVSLNFSEGSVGARQIKARVFEVPAMGGLLLTEDAPFLGRYYRAGEEVAVFDGVDDLARSIRRYETNPEARDRVARAGFERTKAEHTYEARFAALLAEVERRAPAPRRRGAVDWTAFDGAERRHRVGPGLRALRALLVALCVPIWGRARGPRAARRFLFECAWRLAGRRTYTAAGSPGRLFYGES